MPTRASIANRDAEVRTRLTTAITAISGHLGLDERAPLPFERNPELRRLAELEDHAAFLESIQDTLPKTAKNSKAKAAPEIEAADDDVTLGAEVTQDGTPVVVTEAIDGEPIPAAKKNKA